MLIKIHDYHQGFADASRLVLYSYRDIRDALASVKRKFDRQPSLALADHLIAQDEKWVGIADLVMRYESMLEGREVIVVQLAETLGVQGVDPAEIIEQVATLKL